MSIAAYILGAVGIVVLILCLMGFSYYRGRMSMAKEIQKAILPTLDKMKEALKNAQEGLKNVRSDEVEDRQD